MQEKVPVGGFKYRVQWRLLISPKMSSKSTDLQRYRRQFDSTDLEPITSEKAKELGIAEEFIGDEENVTKLNWDSPPGKLRKFSRLIKYNPFFEIKQMEVFFNFSWWIVL